MGISRFFGAVVAAGGALAVLSSGGAQAALCPVLPNVSCWTMDTKIISRTVERRYNGDWAAYLQRCNTYQRGMTNIYSKGGTFLA